MKKRFQKTLTGEVIPLKRETVKEELGFLPISVWDYQMDSKLKKIIDDTEEDIVYNPKAARRYVSVHHTRYDKGVREVKLLRLTLMNPSVAMRAISFWSSPGDTIIDPFGSRGVNVIVANYLGRNGICYEVVPKYVQDIERKFKRFEELYPDLATKTTRKVICASSHDMHHIEDNSMDMCYGSPPYWDLEKYEPADGQLASYEDYNEFLDRLQLHVNEVYRVLKPGKFIVWMVQDFRKENKFYNFHGDVIKLFENAGFQLWDIVILYNRSPMQIFVGMADKMKWTIKTHEYLLVGKKT